jgi:hypothetical protein
MEDNKIKVHLLDSNNKIHKTIQYGFRKNKDESTIYLDDTIEIVKKKIIIEVNKTEENKISYDEIYLFGHQKIKLNLLNIYNTITDEEKIKITPNTLNQLCINLGMKYKNVKINTYEEFRDFLGEENTFSVCCPIGLEFGSYEMTPYLFPVNPLNMVLSFPHSNQTINYFEQKLLFEYLPQPSRDIFVCLVRDLEHNRVESEFNLFKNYFPNLSDKNIVSFKAYHDENPALILETEHYSKEIATTNIDLFIQNGQEQGQLEVQGIQSFTMYMLPNVDEQIPSLDIIFKNIHATKTVPLIYYPTNINNTFRLYCDKISTNGKKIPALDKTRIMRLWRDIDKNKKITGINKDYVKKKDKITLFIQTTDGDSDEKLELFMDFKSNGVITVYNEKLQKIISVRELEAILLKTVNPILQSINEYLNETGFNLEIHETIENNPHIKIENIVYKFKTNITDDMKIKEILECSQFLFLPVSIQPKHSELIYKRVSQFKRMNAKAFYVSQQIQELSGDLDIEKKIVDGLLKNFTYLSKKDATQLFRTGLEHHSKNSEIPSGFFTFFDVDERKELVIEIRSISNIIYLKLLNVYIQGLLNVSKNGEYISLVCEEKEDVIMDEEIIETVFESNDDSSDDDDDSDEDDDDSDDDNKKHKKIGYISDNDDEDDDDEDDDDDDEKEDEKEEEEEEEEEEKTVTNTGKPKRGEKISTILLKRLQNQAPKLFKYKEDNKDPYSRKCPGDNKPVILSLNEKNEIDDKDKKYDKSYEKALLYEYDKKSKFYFICPRYWSVSENRSISEKELKEGQANHKYKIINRFNEKTEIGNVYEFTAHNKKNSNRIPELKSIKNPAGLPLPCCYEVSKKENDDKKNKPVSEYISEKDPPIENGRLGFLPTSLELFFNIQRSDFMDMKKPRYNVPTLLRYGVHSTPSSFKQQSFLACFADMYSFFHSTPQSVLDVSISDIILKIIKGVDLDFFIKIHNSSLVSIFKPTHPNYTRLKESLSQYKNTKFFATVNLKDAVQETFLLDTIASYHNFIEYIKDPQIIKDHVYLWDIFTTKNPLLMNRDVNLIIIEIVEDDSTQKIKILCPSSVYSSHFYNKHNENILLLKKNNYYEPICVYVEIKEGDSITKQITKTFNYEQLTKMKMNNIVGILELINKNVFQKCLPKTAPQVKTNITASQLYKIIKETDEYAIQYQVFNFNHKAIGFYIYPKKDKTDNEIFIPCFPSQPIDEIINATYIDNTKLWKPYLDTIEALEKVYTVHHKKIHCRPLNVVVETQFDEKHGKRHHEKKKQQEKKKIPIHKLTVGILTETNQFVQVVERPYDPVEHTLPILEQSNFNTIDKIMTTTGSKEDNERVKVVHDILLEGQFYSAFRTTLRYLLNDYRHRNVRYEILDMIQSDRYFYKDKITFIQTLLRDISKEEIEFSEYDADVLPSPCHKISPQTDGETCHINIPKTNLVNEVDNENYYYTRLADELLRYKRIRLYMLEDTINMVDIEYKINENELIIIKNLLLPEGKNAISYLDNLETFQTNKYVQTITYDTAQPYSTKIVDEVFTEIEPKKVNVKECILSEGDVIGNINTSVWRKYFNPAKEITFNNSDEKCTFEVLVYIVNTHNETQKIKMTYIDMKEILIKSYKKIAQYLPALLGIWVHDKKITKKQLPDMNIKNVEDFIRSDKYFLTDIDIWLVADELNLPIILFCTTGLKLLKSLDYGIFTWISLTAYDANTFYYFIRSPSEDSVNKSIKPKYQLITPKFKPTILDLKKSIPEQTNSLVEFLRKIPIVP